MKGGRLGFPMWMYLILEFKKGKSKSEAARDMRATYSHISKLSQEMTDKGWIKPMMSGRVQEILFSEQGIKVSQIVASLMKEVKK